MAEAAKWYVVHTYSGYENTVKATIEKTIETRQLQDLIHVVSIPMETVTEITDNGPKTYDRKVFPGYVLVKMIMSDEAWYIIKNVRGVTGFVGSGTCEQVAYHLAFCSQSHFISCFREKYGITPARYLQQQE